VLYPGDNEGISLKRPVEQSGSILLAELAAILMVLEHCIAALKDGFTDIKILSDSQTAVGILILNWKSSNYIDTISDIKENLGTLMRYGNHEYCRKLCQQYRSTLLYRSLEADSFVVTWI
jgi:ribonuclease HI